MKKKKNTKLDLVWIIPEYIGCVGIMFASTLHIRHIPSPSVIGLMEWIFQVGLVMVVLGVGFKGLSHASEELKEIWATNKS